MAGAQRIQLYGTETCSFCLAARMLLKKKNLDFEDITVSRDASLRAEMEERSGRRTVPQIFIDGEAIGGFEELYELDRAGELDRLLGSDEAESKTQNGQD